MEGHIIECACEDFKLSWPQIIGAQYWADNHGVKYTGVMIRFCPFCGVRLPTASAGLKDISQQGIEENDNPDILYQNRRCTVCYNLPLPCLGYHLGCILT